MSAGFIYILECADGTFYTGSTVNLKKRLEEHQEGLGAYYTCKRRPVELVYYEEFSRIDEAFAREHQVKKWSKDKKRALIASKNKELVELAKKRF